MSRLTINSPHRLVLPAVPKGLSELSVRQWVCTMCGTSHDRDINAARNTLAAGLGTSHEVSYVS